MRFLNREQVRSLDQAAANEMRLSEDQLVEAAGFAVFKNFLSEYSEDNLVKNRLVQLLVLVGPGNNGVDALVLCRVLIENDFAVRAVVFGDQRIDKGSQQLIRSQDLWTRKFESAEAAGLKVTLEHQISGTKLLNSVNFIFDGIYGIGLSRPISDDLVKLIESINHSKIPVIAIDIPTGLDSDTGWALPICFKCKMTVTMGLPKPGLVVNLGPANCGIIHVEPLLFSKELLKKHSGRVFSFGYRQAKKFFPARADWSNKGDYGNCMIVAGSPEFPGAGLLSAKASVRAGAGYTYLINSKKIFSDFSLIPEVILQDDDVFQQSRFQKATWVMGPGSGVTQHTGKKILSLLKGNYQRVILDADALTVIAKYSSDWGIEKLPAGWILTPHPGELARMMNCTVKEIQSDRIAWATKASQRWGCVVLLKGYRSIIAFQNKAVIILAGNSALAKAGSGDVLAGFMGAFRAQGLSPLIASCLAAYVHGAIADRWVRKGKDPSAFSPTDLLEGIAEILFRLRPVTKFS